MNVNQELAEIERLANGGPDGMDAVNQFAALDRERIELEDKIKHIKQQCDDLQPAVLDWFQRQGIENIRTTYGLVHIVKRLKVVPKMGCSKDDVCLALENTGHADLVTTSYHWTRMSSLAKQAEEEGVDLPSELLSVIDINEEFKVQTRK